MFIVWACVHSLFTRTTVACSGDELVDKAGKSNNKAIAIYFVVVFLVIGIPCIAVNIMSQM